MGCNIDWPLLLQFVKALAGPAATVVAVGLVSSQALRTFRGQKTIERRLDWYERLLRQIDHVVVALNAAGLRWKLAKDQAETKAAAGDFGKAVDDLRDLFDSGFMYATATGLVEVKRLTDALHEFLGHQIPADDFSNYQVTIDVCNDVSTALANDIRREMGMNPLGPPRPSRLHRVWSAITDSLTSQ